MKEALDIYMKQAQELYHNNVELQDLVFSVKLQFGKTLVSVQNKFALQKDFLFRKFWTKNKYKFQEKFLLQKILGPKNLSLWKENVV